MLTRRAPHFFYVTSILVLCLFASLAFSQEKPGLKDFGSSLKRLKWDPKQNAAVETKPKSKTTANSNDEVDVVRVETSLVMSDVSVLDQRGNWVPRLTEKDFLITEDGKSQQVGMLALGDNTNVPRSIVFIIDHCCAQLPFLPASVAAAKIMIDKLGPKDRMAIVTDDIELLIGFTHDQKKLKEKLDELIKRTSLNLANKDLALERFSQGLSLFGRGFQYSALMAVLKEAFDNEDQRPIIIFQTDGQEAYILRDPVVIGSVQPGLPSDMKAEAERYLKRHTKFQQKNRREFSLNDVYKAAEKSRATIYTLVPGYRLLGLSDAEMISRIRDYHLRGISYLGVPWDRAHPANRRNQDRLNQMPDEALRFEAEQMLKQQAPLAVLSTITGGWTQFFDQPSQVDEMYSHIFSDINHRYLVGYYPTNKEHDGKRRKINIEVRGHPEYVVMGRKTYYAPGPDQ